MSTPLDTTRYFRYECGELPKGVRLHVISHREQPDGFLSVSVATAFGSTHLSCPDGARGLVDLPAGTAHFMEHLLFWLYFDDVLVPMSYKYLRDPNAAVTYDRSVWGIGRAAMIDDATSALVLDQRRLAEAAGDIARSFLSVLGAVPPRSKVEALMEKTVNDVELEIGHRHNLDYLLKLRLLSCLYSEDPIRLDILGTRESLKQINVGHIYLALKIIRTNLRSVTVMGHSLSDEFVSEVRRLVSEALDELPAEEAANPLAPPAESAEVHELSGGLRAGLDLDWAAGVLGIKLPPVQQSSASAEEARRMFLINYMAMNHLGLGAGGILSPRARAYFIAGHIEDPWFYWERFTIRRVIDDLRQGFIKRLDSRREEFEAYLSGALKLMMREPRNLMKLCNAADLFGYKLDEVAGALVSLRREDFEKLFAELRDARSNVSLAYTEK